MSKKIKLAQTNDINDNKVENCKEKNEKCISTKELIEYDLSSLSRDT